ADVRPERMRHRRQQAAVGAALRLRDRRYAAMDRRYVPEHRLRGERRSRKLYRERVPLAALLCFLTTASIAISSAISASNSLSGTMFGPSEGARSGSSCVSMKTPATPTATAARASTGTKRRSPPELVPCPPGCCTECVASNTTGQPVSAMIGRPRISVTIVLEPNEEPRSARITLELPEATILVPTFFISQGARNCPFFAFTTRPVLAAATRMSVCLHKNAGICSTSTTGARSAHCAAS